MTAAAAVPPAPKAAEGRQPWPDYVCAAADPPEAAADAQQQPAAAATARPAAAAAVPPAAAAAEEPAATTMSDVSMASVTSPSGAAASFTMNSDVTMVSVTSLGDPKTVRAEEQPAEVAVRDPWAGATAPFPPAAAAAAARAHKALQLQWQVAQVKAMAPDKPKARAKFFGCPHGAHSSMRYHPAYVIRHGETRSVTSGKVCQFEQWLAALRDSGYANLGFVETDGWKRGHPGFFKELR